MRKNFLELSDEKPKPRRSRLAKVLTLVVGLLVAPLIYEGSAILAAQWKSMYGAVVYPKTPVLDFLTDTYKQGRQDLGGVVTPVFRVLPWKPAVVIPFAIAWTGLAALMLRRG